MSWLDNISNSVDMNMSKLWEVLEGRGAWCAAVHGVAESDRTQWLTNSSTYKAQTRPAHPLLRTLPQPEPRSETTGEPWVSTRGHPSPPPFLLRNASSALSSFFCIFLICCTYADYNVYENASQFIDYNQVWPHPHLRLWPHIFVA